jgi:SAM-dependent methyltransferase
LIERYDLRGKRILEIGCGKGEFLLLLAELGGCEGVGIDPSARQDRIAAAPGADSVTLITEYYREDHGAQGADAVVCKMTLEHISEPFEFVSTIRRGLDAHPNTVVFFQIPEALRILKTCAFEDIYHEHCSYFTPSSLEGLFRRCGFHVRAVGTEYDEQYLTIEAFPTGKAGQADAASPDEVDLASLDDLVRSFPERVAQAQASWRKLVLDTKSAGQRVLLWGSGSKTVSFMSTLGLGDVIDDVVDVNPYRQGHYMPGSGQRILAPSEIPQFAPDLVIVMNRIYEPEITSSLHGLGCRPRIASL